MCRHGMHGMWDCHSPGLGQCHGSAAGTRPTDEAVMTIRTIMQACKAVMQCHRCCQCANGIAGPGGQEPLLQPRRPSTAS